MADETHILVIDDQQDILDALSENLIQNGFSVTTAKNAKDGRRELESQSVDLVVLDIMMPGEDGLSLCRYLSETTQTPVILLTALADDTDRIVGLEIGADDYVSKPFNPRELVARIRAVLRRSQEPVHKEQHSRIVQFGTWSLDRERAELKSFDDVVVPLSTGEFKLLSVFIEHIGQVLSRDDLMTLTKGREAFPFERSLDNMISRLRRKVETDPAHPEYIKTVWGGGYKFAAGLVG